MLDFLKRELLANEGQTRNWYQHCVEEGLYGVEELMRSRRLARSCCYGDIPTLADIRLIPQGYNARRFNCDLEPFPIARKVYAFCDKQPAFRSAAPENHADKT